MASARIQAKSGTVEGKENSTTILKEREMAYIYPDEIGKGNVRLICGDGNTEIKDLPYVGGDDAADMQVSWIANIVNGEIEEGMTLGEIIGIIKNFMGSITWKMFAQIITGYVTAPLLTEDGLPLLTEDGELLLAERKLS